MSLAKSVRSLVNRAVARGAIYEGHNLKLPDGTVIVGVPQDNDLQPDKLRKFQIAVTGSGVLDWPVMNGHHDEPEEPEEPNPGYGIGQMGLSEPVEMLTTAEAAERLGVTVGAVSMAIMNGRLPSTLGPPREGGRAGRNGVVRWLRSDDVEEYRKTRRPGGPRPKTASSNGHAPAPPPNPAALVAAVRPSAGGTARTRYDMSVPSGRLSAGVAQVRAVRPKLEAALNELQQGLDAIEAEATGMLHELADARSKVKKVEKLIGRAVDIL